MDARRRMELLDRIYRWQGFTKRARWKMRQHAIKKRLSTSSPSPEKIREYKRSFAVLLLLSHAAAFLIGTCW